MIGSANVAAQLKAMSVVATRSDPRHRVLRVSGVAEPIDMLIRPRSAEILDLGAKSILKSWNRASAGTGKLPRLEEINSSLRPDMALGTVLVTPSLEGAVERRFREAPPLGHDDLDDATCLEDGVSEAFMVARLAIYQVAQTEKVPVYTRFRACSETMDRYWHRLILPICTQDRQVAEALLIYKVPVASGRRHQEHRKVTR